MTNMTDKEIIDWMGSIASTIDSGNQPIFLDSEPFKAATSRLQSLQWRPIEEIPHEWKDGRGLIGFCKMNECQLECWYDGSSEMNGWVSTHAWGDEIDISFVKPISDPPTAFNQEEE